MVWLFRGVAGVIGFALALAATVLLLPTAAMATAIVSGFTNRIPFWTKDPGVAAEALSAGSIPWRYGQAVTAHIWHGLWSVTSGRPRTGVDPNFSEDRLNAAAVVALLFGAFVVVIFTAWLIYG